MERINVKSLVTVNDLQKISQELIQEIKDQERAVLDDMKHNVTMLHHDRSDWGDYSDEDVASWYDSYMNSTQLENDLERIKYETEIEELFPGDDLVFLGRGGATLAPDAYSNGGQFMFIYYITQKFEKEVDKIMGESVIRIDPEQRNQPWTELNRDQIHTLKDAVKELNKSYSVAMESIEILEKFNNKVQEEVKNLPERFKSEMSAN